MAPRRKNKIERVIIGIYRNVWKEYLVLYLNEFSFRFNKCKNPGIFYEVLRGW